MGKKGIILDNGKSSKSSMALYWDKAKQKQPKAQNKTEQKQQPVQGDVESRAQSAFEKWKVHKQKMITKNYQAPKPKPIDQKQQYKQQEKEQEQFQNNILQQKMKKNRPLSIPGFKGIQQVKSKLQFQTVKKETNQSSNKLNLPPGYQDLTNEDIIQMLREKKAKKQLSKMHERTIPNQQNRNFMIAEDNPLFGIRKEMIEEKVEEQIKQAQKKEEQPFFKSDFLNNFQQVKADLLKKQEQTQKEESIKQLENLLQAQKEQKRLQPKFIPRALLKK